MVIRPLQSARRVLRPLRGIRSTVDTIQAPAEVAAQAPPTLRVAHFSDTWLPRRDGIITVLQTLASTMDRLGHSSLLVVPRHPDLPKDDKNLLQIPSVPIGIAQFRIASWPRSKHVEKIAHWLPNVVHVHTPGPIGLLGIFTARRLGLPLVLHYHTDLPAYADAYRLPTSVLKAVMGCYAMRLSAPKLKYEKTTSRDERRRSVIDTGTSLLFADADAVLVPTPAILNRCGGLPLLADRIYIAPAGVGLPEVPAASRGAFRHQHGVGLDEPMVLFVGRVNREKGIDTLTEAFGHVLKKVPNARLVMVGAVYEKGWVKGLIDKAGIAERTVLTGQLPPDEVAKAYAAADVFAFPSMTDTQGLVVQEAGLAGLPSLLADPALHASSPIASAAVLASNDPAEYGRALTELLTDPERRMALGQAARDIARTNSPDEFAELMTTVYGRAVRRAASATRESRRRRFRPSRAKLIA
jgi:1,2-diacylglycerol 3-alpha-glucosyltransferase